MDFITELDKTLRSLASSSNAAAMEKYMKYNFQFLGIKTTPRRKALKEVWKRHKEEVASNARTIGKMLFRKNEREFHHCGVEILIKELKNNYVKSDKKLIEELISTNSWWDTVDFLAKYLLGNYLLQFPEETDSLITKFSDSNNMWLNRSAILFQLNYKENTEPQILFRECIKHSASKEFFIQKAIGWALREYGKCNPLLVKDFVEQTDLKPLSKREAIRKLRITNP